MSLIITAALEDAGAAAVETVSTVDQALTAVDAMAFAGAILDGNLHGKAVDAVAAALVRRQIPFGRDGETQ